MNLKIYHFFLIIAFIGVISCGKDTAIDNAPKPLICLVKSYSSINRQNSLSAAGGISNLIYNDEGKVIEAGYDGSRKSIYVEDKLNFGSDSKPYVTQFDDNELSKKVYCDKNGRVNREEYFLSSKEKYPSFIKYFEYDNNGYHRKTTSKSVNILNGEFTGNYSIGEYEYVGDNIIKYYSTFKTDTEYIERFLRFSYLIGSTPIKTKIEYLYNYGINGFGKNDKFYPSFKIYYNSDGSKNRDGSYVYEFDSNGYLLSSIVRFNSNSYEREYDYTYECK